jgi:hypothetical protein
VFKSEGKHEKTNLKPLQKKRGPDPFGNTFKIFTITP